MSKHLETRVARLEAKLGNQSQIVIWCLEEKDFSATIEAMIARAR